MKISVSKDCTITPGSDSYTSKLLLEAATTKTYTLKDVFTYTLSGTTCGTLDTFTVTPSGGAAGAALPYATATQDVD